MAVREFNSRRWSGLGAGRRDRRWGWSKTGHNLAAIRGLGFGYFLGRFPGGFTGVFIQEGRHLKLLNPQGLELFSLNEFPNDHRQRLIRPRYCDSWQDNPRRAPSVDRAGWS